MNNLWKQFGGHVTADSQRQFKRSAHWRNESFQN